MHTSRWTHAQNWRKVMTIENAIMRLSDLIMEREQFTELIQKELKYNISESAKTSVIVRVDFLNDEIETLKDILKELD
ncbi:hypothetical protein EMGBD3_04330 [Nitrosarchaeum sp.]|nr:hypothetical protein EMGBD3_04330 [Nitrosarchaeum sp.]